MLRFFLCVMCVVGCVAQQDNILSPVGGGSNMIKAPGGNPLFGETLMAPSGGPLPAPLPSSPADPNAVVATASDGKPLKQVAVVLPSSPCACASPPCSSCVAVAPVTTSSFVETAESTEDPVVLTPVSPYNSVSSGTIMVANQGLSDPSRGVTIMQPSNGTYVAPGANLTGSVGVSMNGKPLYPANVVNNHGCECGCACAVVVQQCACCNTFCTTVRFAEQRATISSSSNLRGHIKLNVKSLKAKLLQKEHTEAATSATPEAVAKEQVEKQEAASKLAAGQVKQQYVNTAAAQGLSTTNAATSSASSGCGPDTVIAIKNTNIVQKINAQCATST